MNYFFCCLSAELVKTKRSLSLLSVIAMPSVLSLFNFLLLAGLHAGGEYRSSKGWVHFEHNTITFWSLLVFPCVVVLVSAFAAHQEHDTQHWRRLMCLPLPKSALYLAKLVMVMGLTFFACLMLWLENIGWGWLFSVVRPDTGLSIARFTPWATLAPFLWIFLFSLLIIAVHFWFSMRVQNFALSIGLGFAFCLAGMFLRRVPFWKIAFPWTLPSLAYTASGWPEVMAGLLVSSIGFAVIVAVGCRSFNRWDVLS